MENGLYIYGIIPTNMSQEFDGPGIGGQNVSTLSYKDIAAVVSKHPLISYNLMNKEDVVKNLVFHEAVIERVMKRFTVLPVKFGTVVATEDMVREFLTNGYPLLSHELSKMEGKIELDVVAWWEVPKMLAFLSTRNEEIRGLQQKLATGAAPVAVEDKILLGRAIERALQQEKVRYQQFLLSLLKQEAIDVSIHGLADDEMVFNAAFLLEKANEERFNAAVQTGDQELESLLNFRVVGPLPPYSFSTILFKKRDPQKIEQAKRVLGLTGEVTDKALRDAYYQGAKQYHPDAAEGENSEEFQQLHEAHEILEDLVSHGWISTEISRWKEEDEITSR